MIDLKPVDLTQDEVMQIKNTVFTFLMNTEIGKERLDTNVSNLINAMHYCFVIGLLSTGLDSDRLLFLLKHMYKDAERMIIEHKAQEGLE